MFRFTIRDVLWLTVVALACGWWIERRELSERVAVLNSEKWQNYYFTWQVGRLWPAEVKHDVEFTPPDGFRLAVTPNGEVPHDR
jgi:hypothetical protein